MNFKTTIQNETPFVGAQVGSELPEERRATPSEYRRGRKQQTHDRTVRETPDVSRSRIDRRPHLLILGSAEHTNELIRVVRRFECASYKLLGWISLNGSHAPVATIGIPTVGTSKDLREYILRNTVDIVLVSTSLSDALSKELIEPIFEIGLTVAVPEGVTISLDPSFNARVFRHRERLFGIDATLLSTVRQKRSYLLAKRILDIAFSSSLLLLLSPLLLLTALVLKLNSPKASVLYRLHWLGKNGRPFTGYKFRTMVPDADKLKKQLLAFNEMQGPVFKMRNDPRVLPLGKLLRKFSIDELPQLYSVLKGDLSLVGPRAPLREEVERFEFWQRRKLSVRPGITCLWQINGRGKICNFDEWVRLDLQYIQEASFLLDLKILLRTIPAVLSGRGAS